MIFFPVNNREFFVLYNVIYEVTDTDFDKIKRDFLNEKIFDGKSFWKVE